MTQGGQNELRPDDVVIARVAKARGIRGEVACDIETDFPDRFQNLDEIALVMPGGKRIELRVEDCWFHQDRVVLKFAGYDDMTSARTLVGGRLVIDTAEARQLDNDSYYEYDLLDSEVVTVRGDKVGRVTQLVRTGGTDVLVVVSESGREHLIPFAGEICSEIDLETKLITIDPPEGLLEL